MENYRSCILDPEYLALYLLCDTYLLFSFVSFAVVIVLLEQ
jgi:hypothetical protein